MQFYLAPLLWGLFLSISLPTNTTQSLGGSAVLVDCIENKILLVVNVRRNSAWNLPGGNIDVGDKDTSFTALREAQEEGGFTIEDKLIPTPQFIGQMLFGSSAVNQIWGYSIDGISKTKLAPPPSEILRAEWVDFDSILDSNGTYQGLKVGDEIKSALKAYLTPVT